MLIPEKTLTLKDGRAVIMRSPRPADAQGIIDEMRRTSGETHFMVRYADEVVTTPEAETDFINSMNGSESSFFVVAQAGDRIVGTASITRVNGHAKSRHRGSFGISVEAAFCNAGLGTLMLQEMISIARETPLEQIELGVFADNFRAIHVYEKCGFKAWGVQPRAFRLRDGTYRDEVQMVLRLREP